jgi:hypothetical protein
MVPDGRCGWIVSLLRVYVRMINVYRAAAVVLTLCLFPTGNCWADGQSPKAWVEIAEVSDDDTQNMPEPPASVPDEQGARYAVLINPVILLLGLTVGILYVEPELQIALGDNWALDFVPAFYYYYGWPEGDVIGGGAHLGLRILPSGRGLRCVYFVPRAGILYLRGKRADETRYAMAISPTLEVGYSWIWDNFIMNAGGGGGYVYVASGTNFYEDDTKFRLILNLSIGYAG